MGTSLESDPRIRAAINQFVRRAAAGMVAEGATHEIPTGPTSEEAAAIAAEQQAGAAIEAEGNETAPAADEAQTASPADDEKKED